MEKTVGVLGGGQLGRMLAESANRLNIKMVTLDSEGAPAKQINNSAAHVAGSFRDAAAVRKLAERCDVLTLEIEHVDTQILEKLSKEGVRVEPSWETIRIIQDKYTQKEHLRHHGISSTQAHPLKQNDLSALQHCAKDLGFPFMLKSRTEAYDGRGNFPVKSESDMKPALEALQDRPLYAERWADFSAELAVMVVKTASEATDDWERATKAFPVVKTIHEDSICKLVYAPAIDVPKDALRRAQELGRRCVATFPGKGVFGVEMFLLRNGDILINEIAPRPHNSGHYTIEACNLSQYDAHLRAILDLPIPDGSLDFRNEQTNAIMLNILGGALPDSHLQAARRAMLIAGASIHLYGKDDSRPGRKMGHVTLVGDSMSEIDQRMKPLVMEFDKIKAERAEDEKKMKVDATGKSSSKGETQKSDAKPLVAVTMGSDSDRHVLAPGIRLLDELEIPYAASITSAHRTPQKMFTFAQNAASKGIKVIIAAAGGAAHLPGMIAAISPLPVIGVPVKTSKLEGIDSLLSIVQMPRGCPVATVAIDNSVNAAQLAVRILALDDADIRQRLDKHLQDQTEGVEEKAKVMEENGFHNYPASG